MRLSLLLEREPFGAILTATLARFWGTRRPSAPQVLWHAPSAGPAGAQEWRGNVYLNYFTVADTSTAALAVIRREFARNRSFWRRPAQRVYVDLATARATRRWFSHVAFSVAPQIEDAAGTFVVPGNHRIRLLRPEKNSSVVLLKHSFPERYLAAEIAARQTVAATLAPPLREVAADGTWFAEGYIEGTPANRLPLAQERDALSAAIDGLREHVIAPTLEVANAPEWAEQLNHRVDAMLRVSSTVDAELGRRLREAAARLAKIVCSADELQLCTAQTHGDFQPGNILCTDQRVWLIDWEGAGRRWAGYDFLCLLLDVRLDPRWSERLASLLDGTLGQEAATALTSWPGVDWSPSSRRATLAGFVLEEMCYVLDDALQPFRLAPLERLRELAHTIEVAEKQLANRP